MTYIVAHSLTFAFIAKQKHQTVKYRFWLNYFLKGMNDKGGIPGSPADCTSPCTTGIVPEFVNSWFLHLTYAYSSPELSSYLHSSPPLVG